jgi:release factor glutamine methyltransferase
MNHNQENDQKNRPHDLPGVLIPRPETAELCQWIIADHTPLPSPCEVLDIGTGSGCIAITLAAELPDSKVTA